MKQAEPKVDKIFLETAGITEQEHKRIDSEKETGEKAEKNPKLET